MNNHSNSGYFVQFSLLILIVIGAVRCAPEVVHSDWEYIVGNDLEVRVDTLVSPSDTTLTIGEMNGLAIGDQHVYLADNMAMRIHVFDNNGNFLRSIGKRGRGPGEFLNMTAIAWFPQRQEIVVYDHMNFRLSRLDHDGNFVGSCSYTPNDIEWPRQLMELDSQSHIAVFLISNDLETDGDMYLLHQIDTETCTIQRSAVSMKELDQYKRESDFFGVFSLFSPGYVVKIDGDVAFKTAIDDGYLYYLRPEDLSLKSAVSIKQTDEEPPYYAATEGMERDPRVMAISGRISSAAVLQSDLVGFGEISDDLMYQVILHRPSADSASLFLDILNSENQTRTRHMLNHDLPISLDGRRGFAPAFRVLGYANGAYYATSFYDGHYYLFRFQTNAVK